MGAIVGLGLALLPAGASAGGVSLHTGTATDSFGLPFTYKIEVPSPWNGTLVLYSHGYSFSPSAAADAGDPVTGAWLLSHGYALAGSSYSTSGWALQQAFVDQIDTLDIFNGLGVGTPSRTIAWGHSLGGMITAGLVQLFPERFTAALPMCGVVAGGAGVWNQGLDSEFALATLQFPGAFKLVRFTSIADASHNFGIASADLAAAQGTAQGRARIALGAALADVPGWFDPTMPEPAPTDYAAQEANQFQWDNNPDFLFGFFGRFELEQRAGGNFSWNTGVDYRDQLSHSSDRAEVKALYAAAGLDLNKDLDTLNDTTRIAADPGAAAYVTKYITYNGELGMPVLTMHTTGDGLVEVTDENAYASVVRSAGDSAMLHQIFVHRAGHCTFTPAETITAFQTLIDRLNTGRWSGTSAVDLNARAASLGPAYNILLQPPFPAAGPGFIRFHPESFLRPFDVRNTD
ncbi:MAG TPA: prolyl oligopeptidase family serine peptidase [Candidatus Dormibacteraeota bacterium]|nr:prolyl oligopeptidase family serine peptidase [Candidatus Dormibacteraeota bacterium]